MNYLQILSIIRSITGARTRQSFPQKDGTHVALGSLGYREGILLVYSAPLGKAILESDCFSSYNFLEKALSLAGEENTRWIRRFCAESPVMQEGKEHQVSRRDLAIVLQSCADTLQDYSSKDLAIEVLQAAATPQATSLSISEILTARLLGWCIAAITGKPVALPLEDLRTVDFFNPFPKPSTLKRCDLSIARCMEAMEWGKLSSAKYMAVSTMVVMGFSPLLATITSSLNQLLETLSSSDASVESAIQACQRIDYNITVPTNFVMRECIDPVTIDGIELAPGDLVYVFLGTASGCPFSRLTAIPFGAGRHFCSGTKLSQMMLKLAQGAMADSAQSLRKLPVLPRPTPIETGRATAFLSFRDPEPSS